MYPSEPFPHFVDDYLAAAAAIGAPIVAVFETHVQADHLSGLPALVERAGATPYLPAGALVYIVICAGRNLIVHLHHPGKGVGGLIAR